ncbi:TlpA family protein disulfide reductase [Corallibacter sp.]|uniref:TlpA family protein disulfide reductase n=1 Tax=Corallibacter sp. TaxID=2038084 RepID=UPI003AB55C38
MKLKTSNIILIVVIVLLIVPQTRKPIQVFLNKGLAMISPSVTEVSERASVNNYDWKLLDATGAIYNFNDAKNKVVVVNFWATWCPPCIAEMPSLYALYEDYKDEVVFLFVSNESVDTTTKFLRKHQYQIPTFQPKTTIPSVFQVSSIPRTFLIDKKGMIVVDKTGAANWNSKAITSTIDKLLLD